MNLKMYIEASTHYIEASTHYIEASTQPMTVVAPATSLSIHQVLAPLQLGASLQIRAPPLHQRQLTQSWNSKQ